MNDRDTHFLGFAGLLLARIKAAQEAGAPSEYIEKLIAQAGYDLVYHTLYYEGDPDPVTDWSLLNILKRIPDLTEWPD